MSVGKCFCFNLFSIKSLNIEYITANKGTPIIIPTIPNNLAPIKRENSIQNAEIPSESPSILGPIILPSNCCINRTISKNQNAFTGDKNKIMKNDGIAPINGPKKGIIFVIPMIKDTKIEYGILNIESMKNVIIPTISESSNLPLTNRPKILLVL